MLATKKVRSITLAGKGATIYVQTCDKARIVVFRNPFFRIEWQKLPCFTPQSAHIMSERSSPVCHVKIYSNGVATTAERKRCEMHFVHTIALVAI